MLFSHRVMNLHTKFCVLESLCKFLTTVVKMTLELVSMQFVKKLKTSIIACQNMKRMRF